MRSVTDLKGSSSCLCRRSQIPGTLTGVRRASSASGRVAATTVRRLGNLLSSQPRRGTNEGGIEDDVVGSSSDVSWTECGGSSPHGSFEKQGAL